MRPDELTTDIGSVVDGKEAVEIGLIDEIGGLDAVASGAAVSFFIMILFSLGYFILL